MIQFLCAEKGLTREEAYMLCSVAGDLRMHEVVSRGHTYCVRGAVFLYFACVQVDMPNYVVSLFSYHGLNIFS